MSASTRTTLIRLVASILIVLSFFLFCRFANGQAPISPSIETITPSNATIDQSITITGSNFGTADNTNYTQLGLLLIDTTTGQTARFGSIKTSVWTDNQIVFKLDHRSSFLHNATLYTIQIDSYNLLSNSYPYRTGSYRVFLPFLSR